MKPNHPLPTLGVMLAMALLANFAAAQERVSGTATRSGSSVEKPLGAVEGRVFDSTRNAYVRDAIIHIVGTSQSTSTGGDGAYRLEGIGAAEITLEVSYIGNKPIRRTVLIQSAQTQRQDFDLSDGLPDGNSPIALETFRVSAEKQGNAKAIMRQRSAVNIVTSLASDVFGDIPDGNIATFVKDLPGVDIETSSTVDRTPRLRGLPGDYVGLTIDGLEMASIDASGSQNEDNARSFIFEQLSLNSMGAIEIHKTVSADQEANAPAGTIDLRTKRAHEMRGRSGMWLASASGHSSRLTLNESVGPDESGDRRRILPSGILEYSDLFLKERLGVVFNLSYANVYVPSSHVVNVFDLNPTTADPRPAVITGVTIGRSERANESLSATFTSDFRVSDSLTASFAWLYNWKDNEVRPYRVSLATGARNTVVGNDPLLAFSTSNGGAAGRSFSVSSTTTSKYSESMSFLPRLEYRKGNLVVEAKMIISEARSQYQEEKHGKLRAVTVNNLTNVSFTASRSSLTSGDWRIQQTSGPDWADLANYTNPRIGLESRKATKDILSPSVTASFETGGWLPVSWKLGGMTKKSDYWFRNQTPYQTFQYVGPGGGASGSFAMFPSPYDDDLGMLDGQVLSISGRETNYLNHQTIYSLYQSRPDYFVNTGTVANYYSAFIENSKELTERIGSAFAMGTGSLGKAKIRIGLRWETTRTESIEEDPRKASETQAAGFPVTNGRATTIAGLNYQYFSKPLATRSGEYDYFFPSASMKYDFTRNFSGHLGYSRTIRRPTFRDVTGLMVIDDAALTVTLPNPNLEPEISDNISARLAYYFEPVGILSVDLYELRISGMRTVSQFTSQEFGFGDDPILRNYRFISGSSSSREDWLRGAEIEYRQSLSFLPSIWKGLTARLSYSRSYASSIRPLLTPNMVKGGLDYRYRSFDLNTSFRWTGATPFNDGGTLYRRQFIAVDLVASFALTNRLSMVASGRNITDEPIIYLQKYGGGGAVGQAYDSAGAQWSLGVKGTF